jgi:hypothetical protein
MAGCHPRLFSALLATSDLPIVSDAFGRAIFFFVEADSASEQSILRLGYDDATVGCRQHDVCIPVTPPATQML